MIKCQKCGKELPDKTKFCNGCGTKVPEIKKEVKPADKPKKKKSKGLKIALISGSIGAILIAAVAVLLAIVIALVAVFFIFIKPGNKETVPNYVSYVKDGEIYYSDLKVDHPSIQITERLDDNDTAEKSDWNYYNYYLSRLTTLSQDGSLIFYPDKADLKNYEFNLFYREIDNEEFVPVKIDSGVSTYVVSDDAATVTYLRSKDGHLYEYTLETDSREKLASDVSNFMVSEDQTKIIYMTFDGSVYLKTAEDTEKLVSETNSVVYISDDFETIYYLKDSTLYKQNHGDDREKLAADVGTVINVFDSGEVYFTRDETVTVTYMALVNDDLAASDAAITEPVYPTYPDFDDYYYAYDNYMDAYNAYWDAYDAYYDKVDAYWDAYDAYAEKESRDALRARLAEAKYSYTNTSLYYYSGSEEKLVTENYGYTYNYSEDAAILSYSAYDRSTNKKINLSEIDSVWDFEDSDITSQFHENSYVTITIKDTPLEIDHNNVYSFDISDSGEDVYYVDTREDERYGDLYHIEIDGDVASNAKLYDEDVYMYGRFLTDDMYSYYKDYQEGGGELFINGDSIDYDVYRYTYYEDCDTLLYLADWNESKSYGILKSYKDGEIVKISDDVYTYEMSPENDIMYLYDYSTEYCRGELYMWKDQESIKIDDDVSTLLSYGLNVPYFYRWNAPVE